MKTNISKENMLQLVTDYYKQFYLAEMLTEITSCSNDFYPFLSIMGESLFGPEPDNGDSKESYYMEAFCEFAFMKELDFGERATGFIDKVTRHMESKDTNRPEVRSDSGHFPDRPGLTKAQTKKLIIEILQDSVIWYNVSAGLMAVNAAYSPEFNKQYGFEPEEQYHGYAKAYILMGVDDDMSMLLYTLFNAAVDKNKYRPDDRKANAEQLAEEIYEDWALAVRGNTKLSTV